MLRVLIAAALFAVCVDGSCFGGYATLNSRASCKVKEGVVLSEGENRVLTDDCFNCTCDSRGFSCCGIGIKAGHHGVPNGYRLVEDPPCDFHFEPLEPTPYQETQEEKK
ncbi:hypothetical protein BaRGS_00021333 [Batillaria attramentaria]|uniref:Uncharacterized protein n=1 Tax=Batillaria attramentaria TaxID=370345 RepID=A0ABD0KK44_9CAEN